MNFEERISRVKLDRLTNEVDKPVENSDANTALPFHNKSKDGDKSYDVMKSKYAKKHMSMRTSGFQHEEIDELAVGSQFKANRNDELENSVIYLTKKSDDPEKQYDIDKTIVKPKAFLSFEEMDLVDPLYQTLLRRCPEGPTAIQAIAIPTIMESNCDFVIRAPTGSGKTASFLVPIINRIEVEKKCQSKPQDESNNAFRVYAVIICPSRDLAVQLTKDAMEFTKNTSVNVTYAIGEISNYDTKKALRNGSDIVIGTLGRLNAYINIEKFLDTDGLLFLVADEADALERIEGFVEFFDGLKLRNEAQCKCILSSATLGFETSLTLKKPIHIMVKDDMPPPTLVHGLINVAEIPKSVLNNPDIPNVAPPKYCHMLTFFNQHVLEIDSDGFKRLPKTIVYVSGKRKADSLAIQMLRCGFKTFSFHGDKTMDQRTTTLERMKNNEIDVLIATNVLARGLNLKIDYVINYDLPVNQSSYVEFVHRVGRTARVGNYGIALTMFDPRTDVGFAPYLQKMLIHYNMEVPKFIGHVIDDYINNMLISHDGYMEQQIANQQKDQVNICNRSFLAGKLANKTFA